MHYESKEYGLQAVIPGAGRISDKELIEKKLQGRSRASVPQRDIDYGLFDNHNQKELF